MKMSTSNMVLVILFGLSTGGLFIYQGM